MDKTTPLHQWHRSHGAKMAPFAGWDMPIQYGSGAIAEHKLVRSSAGLFDVSHMGQLEVSGPDAVAYLNAIVSADVTALEVMHSTYALLCNEEGGVIDDLFVYRLGGRWLVVVNAGNRDTDREWFQSHIGDYDVTVEDVSDQTAMFALQGPNAIEIANRLTGGDATTIPRFAAAELAIVGVPALIGRTGYTGEDGVELFVSADTSQDVWEGILAGAAQQPAIECGPIGLAARDSLRFEPGFALYGHELTEAVTPIQARLKWACALEKEFIGRDAMLRREDDDANYLATISMTEPGLPRQGYLVYHGDEAVGEVVSGMYAPSVDAYCANVYVPKGLGKTGTSLAIEIRSARRAAVVVKRPLYRPAYR